MKTTSAADGAALYGASFRNYDALVVKHAVATTDARGDQAHFGPQFQTWHGAFILEFEMSLLAIDPAIGACPYWDASIDGAFPASVTLATEKARTAAQFRKPTLDLESAANDKRPALIASGFTVLGGGEPIFVDGYCVGAVGVSGVLPTEDAEVAKAGAAAVCPTTAPPDTVEKAVSFQ